MILESRPGPENGKGSVRPALCDGLAELSLYLGYCHARWDQEKTADRTVRRYHSLGVSNHHVLRACLCSDRRRFRVDTKQRGSYPGIIRVKGDCPEQKPSSFWLSMLLRPCCRDGRCCSTRLLAKLRRGRMRWPGVGDPERAYNRSRWPVHRIESDAQRTATSCVPGTDHSDG
jgi:hypothetical protein